MFLQCFFNNSPSWCVSHESRQLNLTLSVFMTSLSLLWWLRQERICLQCGRPGFDSWVGKIPLEEGMASHSSILAWRIPWTEEPGGLQSTGSQRVRHDWATQHSTARDFTHAYSESGNKQKNHSIAEIEVQIKQVSMSIKKTSLSLIYISIYSFSTLSY